MNMSSTNKGNYDFCSDCEFKIQKSDKKYPCLKSHKAVRISDGVKYERDFNMCQLKEIVNDNNI